MTKKELEALVGHKRQKRHKYGAVATKCNLGHPHPSKAEAMHCWVLQTQMKANQIVDLEYEKPYELRVNGILIAVHKPDFTYRICRPEYPNAAKFIASIFPGTQSELIDVHCVDEVKGFKTPDWILKSKLFKALYPHIEYRVVE